MTNEKYLLYNEIFKLYDRVIKSADPYEIKNLTPEEQQKEEDIFFDNVINGKIPYYVIEFLTDLINVGNVEDIKQLILDIVNTCEKYAK